MVDKKRFADGRSLRHRSAKGEVRLFHNPDMYRTMPVGVVMRRTPGVTRWAQWAWRAEAVLPGAGQADWRILRQEGEAVEYHAATVLLELHGAETEAYLTAISDTVPCVYVVLREDDTAPADRPYTVQLITASPYEAQDYTDSGEEIVEKVPMPPGLIAWVRDFVEAFHEDHAFVKRRRDRERIDLHEDGIGDSRVAKAGDVYASPALKRSRLQ